MNKVKVIDKYLFDLTRKDNVLIDSENTAEGGAGNKGAHHAGAKSSPPMTKKNT